MDVKICSELFKTEDFIVFDAKKRRLQQSKNCRDIIQMGNL